MDKKIGTIGWLDLTVPEASNVKNFYKTVVGWQDESFAMDGYDDYMMKSPSTGETICGICNAKGGNAKLPAQWLVYVYVRNIADSVKNCKELGGKVLTPIKQYGDDGKYCVIKDPAGAVLALYEDLS